VTTSGKDGVKRVTGFINSKIQRATEYTFDKGQTTAVSLARKHTPPPLGPDGQPLPPTPPDGKRPLVSRLLLAGDVLLTSVEASTGQILVASTTSATKSIAHKYGQEAGEAAGLAGGSVRNVGVAFVDARYVYDSRSDIAHRVGANGVCLPLDMDANRTASPCTTPEVSADGRSSKEPASHSSRRKPRRRLARRTGPAAGRRAPEVADLSKSRNSRRHRRRTRPRRAWTIGLGRLCLSSLV
jgi:hypothetical protein